MNLAKKAVSVGVTATLLASLLATAVAGTAFAAAAAPTVASYTTTVVQPFSAGTSFTPATLTFANAGDLAIGSLVITLPSGFTFTSTSSTAPTSGSCVSSGAGSYNAAKTTVTYSWTAANTASCTVTFPLLTVTTSTVGASGSVVASGAAIAAGVSVNVGALSTGSSAGPYGTAVPYTVSSTSVPADGASTIVLMFGNVVPGANTISISTSAGSFTASSGFSFTSGTPTYPTSSLSSITAIAGGGTLTLKAGTTAGTANVIVQLVPTAGGTATYDSITSFTFTGATLPTVSTSYSSTSLSASSAPDTAGSTGITIKTVVADPNNSPIFSGATVTWTLSGPAVFATSPASATTSAVAASATCPSGTGTCAVASPAVTVNAIGVPGKVTVATTVSYLGVTYALANQSFVLYGPPAKVVLSNLASSIADTNPAVTSTTLATGDEALLAVVTDAAGNAITSGVTFGSPTYTPANIFTLDLTGAKYTAPAYDAINGGWTLSAVCTTFGTAQVSVQATVGTTTVTSNAVPLTCADPLGATALGTFTVSAASPTVAPNLTDKISVAVKDDNGLAAPDGTSVLAVTNNVGNVVSSAGTNTATTSNGVATFTYLAPANAGSATVTVFVGNTTTGSAAVTLTIGTPAPPVAYTAASALGVTTSGPFTAATKIPKLGQYITVKFSLGAAAAGKIVTIYEAARTPANTTGTWGAFHGLTTRIADANGNVYFYWKSASAAWLSFYAGLNGSYSNSSQARWM